MKDLIRKNYCFVIACVLLICYAARGGICNNLTGLYLVPVSEGLGVSRTAVSLTSSLRSTGTFLSNIAFGFAIGKLGFRFLAAFGLAVTGLAFLGLASSTSVWMYAGFCLLEGLSEAAFSTAAISTAVRNWFVRAKGLVLGIITAASGLGGSLFAILLTGVMEKKDWRASQTFAGTVLLTAALLIFLLTRNQPSELGSKAFGEGEECTEKEKKKRFRREGVSMETLKKSPVLPLLLVSSFFSALCVYAPYQILFSHLLDKGVGSADAARLQSLMFLLLAGAKVLDGTLCDLLGAKTMMILSALGAGTSCLLLTSVTGFKGAILPTVLLAVSLPATTLLSALSAQELVGSRSYDRVIGLVFACVACANIVVVPMMNAVYDSFGTYDPALFAMAMASVLSVLVYLVLCRRAGKLSE